MLETGTKLEGRYEVLRLLGEGGMAAIYQVRHLGLHSLHALKVLNPDLARDDDFRARFIDEGRIQAKLRHPNIVLVTEIVTDPVAGLVMEYVEGQDLADFTKFLKEDARVPMALELLLPVLDAVEEAHRQKVVHRDLKPENILVGKDSRGRLQPKVTDFGIAKLLDEMSDRRRTRTGMRMGTLSYMSPEQVRGASEVDARADIFALGAILYELVTGRLAFSAGSDFDTMKNIVEGQYAQPERVVGGLPPVIGACIRKALAVDPAERFQDCRQFRLALEEANKPQPVLPERPTRSYAVTNPGLTAMPRAPEAPPPPIASTPLAKPEPIVMALPVPAPRRSVPVAPAAPPRPAAPSRRPAVLHPELTEAVLLQPALQALGIEPLEDGLPLGALHDEDVFQLEQVDQRRRLGGDNELSLLRGAVEHGAQKLERVGVQPQLRLVDDDGGRQFGLEQEGRQADVGTSFDPGKPFASIRHSRV